MSGAEARAAGDGWFKYGGGIRRSDFGRPFNPGDALAFSNVGGAFDLYDENFPRREIRLLADGTVVGRRRGRRERGVLPDEPGRRQPPDGPGGPDRRRRRRLRRPRQRLDRRRHRQGHAVGRLGQRPAPGRRRAPERHARERHDRHGCQLRGPRLRRRRPRRADRQHRRRPADRLGRRVQLVHRALLAVRHRHRQPPGAARAAGVPLHALEGAGRGPDDPADRGGSGAQRRALRRARRRHPAGQRPVADADRRPARSAARRHPRRHARRAPLRELRQRPDAGLLRRQRHLDRQHRAAGRLRGEPRRRRGQRVLRRRLPAGLLRGPRADQHRQADRRLDRERVRHLRLPVPDELQVRRHRHLAQQVRHGPPHRRAAGSSTCSRRCR